MTRTIRIILAALACVTLAASAAAQEGTLRKIKDGGSITIGHRDASVPFSYYDDKQQPVGYAVDLCLRIVDAVKNELKMPRIDVKYQLVTSANRIPLMANGTIDKVKRELNLPNLQVRMTPITSQNRIPLVQNGTIDIECGSTTNNLERQKQVWFTITHFVTANRWVAKRASNIRALPDLRGKTIVSTAGTTNIKQITEINAAQNLGMNIISANGHAEAFQMVETGRAAAFVMDDILLYSLAAQSRSPGDYAISPEALSVEPYGIMLRRDDVAFKKAVDSAMIQTYKSGAIDAIYGKWFLKPIPPRGLTLNVPMSDQFKKVIANPTDSGDPAAYK